jgi:hypothetical protein
MFKGSYDLIKAIIEKVQLAADLKMLLIAIADHWSKDNPNPFPEYDTLVVEAGIPKRTLSRKLKALKEAGWLGWEHGRGRSNIYTLAIDKIEALGATRPYLALPAGSANMALPTEEVEPKLGPWVEPKLGPLTNKEQTIYNKQEVEPSRQASITKDYVLEGDREMTRTMATLFAQEPGLGLEIADDDPETQDTDITTLPAKEVISPLSPRPSPTVGRELEGNPPGWDIRECSSGWSAHGPHWQSFGPFPTREEALASAYKAAETPRKAVEPSMPAVVQASPPKPLPGGLEIATRTFPPCPGSPRVTKFFVEDKFDGRILADGYSAEAAIQAYWRIHPEQAA